MEQEIEQLAQEMTDFCCQELTQGHSIPAQLKTSFVQEPGNFFTHQLGEIRKYYPTAMSTFVMISLLVGNAEGPWLGGRWIRF